MPIAMTRLALVLIVALVAGLDCKNAYAVC
jgi:hypothetical protein